MPLPRDVLNGNLQGYRVIYWANLPDGGNERSASTSHVNRHGVDRFERCVSLMRPPGGAVSLA